MSAMIIRFFFVVLVLIFYILVKNLSVMSGGVFLGWTSMIPPLLWQLFVNGTKQIHKINQGNLFYLSSFINAFFETL